MSREDSYGYDPIKARVMILVFTSGRRLDDKASLIDKLVWSRSKRCFVSYSVSP